MKKPETSVVIPASRKDKLDRCIFSLMNMSYTDFEVIVVLRKGERYDHPSPAVKTVTQSGKGVSNARNAGLIQASGKFVAFLDDDCVASKDWLGSLVNVLKENGIQGAGSIREGLSCSAMSRMWDASYICVGSLKKKYESLAAGDTYLCTSSAAYKSNVARAVGGFDESLPSGEDYDLSRRIRDAGFKLALVPEARMMHEHPSTWREMTRQQMWLGKGDRALARKYRKRAIRMRLLASVPYYTLLAIRHVPSIEGYKCKLAFPAFVFVRQLSRFFGCVF